MSACLCEEEEGEERQALPWSPRDSGTSTLPPPGVPLNHSQAHVGLGRW